MGKALDSIIKGPAIAPIHTQPAETLIPVTQFQETQEPEEKPQERQTSPYARKFKGVKLDPYRIIAAYGITHPAIQHAIKKLLRCGRGSKDAQTDIAEVIEALERWQEMEEEEA